MEKYFFYSLKNKTAQAVLESVICFVLLLTFIFAAMDFAMIANSLFILHDAAKVAARAAAVRENPNLAVINLLNKTIGVTGRYGEFIPPVHIERRAVSSNRYVGFAGPASPLSDSSTQPIKVITATVNYTYRPLFALTPTVLLGRIPLRATYTIMKEPVPPPRGR